MNLYTFSFDQLPEDLNTIMKDYLDYQAVQDFDRLPHYNFFRQLQQLFYSEKKIFIESCRYYKQPATPHQTGIMITLRGKSSFDIHISCNTNTRTITLMYPHAENYCHRSLSSALSYAFNYSRPTDQNKPILPGEKRVIWSGLTWQKNR
ncbi:hypothetical protein KP77_28940 [Jeotgalibacillus alimentarius]|uniref:Uncharacterized protein n=1 Tax=Jeotgalibacillus alimentarius TaxID=135826 RepID=A0A0C2VL07_9BACL|nr:hypothetical protein [Jeotgalibacillus alimentarius]KIL44673.1 hypothetical protein KP77_28940 [Jeotgalibacillus alimentarius]